MKARFHAIREAGSAPVKCSERERKLSAKDFGSQVFNRSVIEKMLPKKIAQNLLRAMDGEAKIEPEYAGEIAEAMREWAKGLGATHYCHWFQPLTGFSAAKYDAMIDWKTSDTIIEKFSGAQLIKGEPDASSFPSGGLRATSRARGHTTWDPTTPAFVWKMGGSAVLCIPSLFFSWTGKALDMKIPLLRSESKINQAAMRLLNLFEVDARTVYSTLGCEQEYFLVDRHLFDLRSDLTTAGRTVCGAPSPKTQELEDHYFGVVKERVMCFMADFEEEAWAMGIPLKTRHNEVAPNQFETAPIFEKSSVASDHNVLLMEIMRQVATRHNLACLFHEKPFAGINGSGKHNNWALSTDTGLNLLDPHAEEGSILLFTIMVTAVVHAIYQHGVLLRASIASASNDLRLGGHEAPPAIISVYLGEAVEHLLNSIEKQEEIKHKKAGKMELGIPALPEIPMEDTDRNRTSPFAFTGNKFEFRAVGASANCAVPMTVLNVIVAESLNQIVDEIEKLVMKKKPLEEAALQVVRKFLKLSKPVRFLGDGYSPAWPKEAKRRGLPIINRSIDAFALFEQSKIVKLFAGVLSQDELESRVSIAIDQYAKINNIETTLFIEMFRTQILPVALEYQKQVGKSLKQLREAGHSIGSGMSGLLKKISTQINQAIESINALEAKQQKASQLDGLKKGKAFSETILPLQDEARQHIDELEKMVDDRLWTLPKYRELLTIL